MRASLAGQLVLQGPGAESSAVQWGRLYAAAVVLIWMASPVVGFLGSLALLVTLGFAGALIGFGRPAISVLGVSLLCTLDPLTRHFLLTTGGLLRWNTFNYMLLAIIAISAGFLWRVRDPHSTVLKALAALLLIGIVISPDYTEAIQHVLGLVATFGLLAYFAQAADDADVWYSVALVNGLAGAVGGLAFFAVREEFTDMYANAWALFPQTALFAICLGFRHAAVRRHGQLILGVLAGTNAVWIFLSGSRGALLMALGSLVFLLLTVRRWVHQLTYVAIALVMAGVISTYFVDEQRYTMSRISKLLDENESTAGRTSGRSDLAIAGWHMFTRHPLGVGTGGFAHSWADLGYVPGVTGFKRGEEFAAHSGWIKVLAENGWPGILLMVAYVGSFTFAGLRAGRPGAASLGLLVTVTLALGFLSTEFQGKALWFLAAAATAQLHPAEMARSVADHLTRLCGPVRPIVGRPAPRRAATVAGHRPGPALGAGSSAS